MKLKGKDEEVPEKDQQDDRWRKAPDDSGADLPGNPDISPWPNRQAPALPGWPDFERWPEEKGLPEPQPAHSSSAVTGER
jgi:hypothetical protein